MRSTLEGWPTDCRDSDRKHITSFSDLPRETLSDLLVASEATLLTSIVLRHRLLYSLRVGLWLR